MTRQRQPDAVRRMQRRLSPLIHSADSPEKFRAISKWWALEGLTSKTPEQCERSAMGQLFIAADMENRPRHHARKPIDKTRYQWSKE